MSDGGGRKAPVGEEHVNWLLSALWRLVVEIPRHAAMHAVKKMFESHGPKTPTPHHPDVAAGEFEVAWKGKSERLPVEKNAVVRRCWLCHAGVVVTKADPDTPVVCIECKDKTRPNPPRAG